MWQRRQAGRIQAGAAELAWLACGVLTSVDEVLNACGIWRCLLHLPSQAHDARASFLRKKESVCSTKYTITPKKKKDCMQMHGRKSVHPAAVGAQHARQQSTGVWGRGRRQSHATQHARALRTNDYNMYIIGWHPRPMLTRRDRGAGGGGGGTRGTYTYT